MKKTLTETEEAILAFIGKRRIKKDEIRHVFKMDEREFYATVEKIRRKGFWLVASKNCESPGYFIAESRNQLELWVDKQIKQIESNLKMLNAMKNSDGLGNEISKEKMEEDENGYE